MKLSEYCREAIDALDASPAPTYEQLFELLGIQRDMLKMIRSFALRIEREKESNRGKVPMFAAAGTATAHYRDLLEPEALAAEAAGVVITFPGRRI
jgi:hypothetical protein